MRTTHPQDASEPVPPIAHLELKAKALVLLMLALLGGSIAYLMYARGAFEANQRLVLVADDSEGVLVGMDLTFSGFPIGRVRRIELGIDGSAHIVIDIPRKDAHWLRSSSVFTLVRGLVGNTNLRAYSGQLKDPPLADGAQRKVLVGDASAEIPKLVNSVRELVANIGSLSAADSALGNSLRNLKSATDKLNGPHGALGLLLGNEPDAEKLLKTLASAEALLARADTMAGKADDQLFGPDGLMRDVSASLRQLAALLGQARASWVRVDALLVDAQAVAANTRGASTDLGALRTEVDTSLRKIQQLLDEVNRKWPFARDTELRLP